MRLCGKFYDHILLQMCFSSVAPERDSQQRSLAAEVEAVVCFVTVPEAQRHPFCSVVATFFDLQHLRLFAGKRELHAAVDSGDEELISAESSDDGAANVQAGGAGCGGDGRSGRIVGRREGDDGAPKRGADGEFNLGYAVFFDSGADFTGEFECGEFAIEGSEQAESFDLRS